MMNVENVVTGGKSVPLARIVGMKESTTDREGSQADGTRAPSVSPSDLSILISPF